MVRRAAVTLVQSALEPRDRVLITGAGGWFGRTAVALALESGVEHLLATGSRARMMSLGPYRIPVVIANAADIAEFDPTVVLNFAFLTRDKWRILGNDRYTNENSRLTHDFVTWASLPSVRIALTVSSGAALSSGDNPYGALKAKEEELALDLVTKNKHIVVLRAWSVSGAFVRQPTNYLFSDLLMQSRTGRIAVSAKHEVIRRYVGVDDLLAVGLAEAARGRCGILDSGGPLVEAGSLAERVAAITGASLVRRLRDPHREPDVYASDDTSWQASLQALDFNAAGLDEQIHQSLNGLSKYAELS